MHPNCRCTTIGYDPEDEQDLIDSGYEELSYEEWYQRHVEGREQTAIAEHQTAPALLNENQPTVPINPLTNAGDGGTINIERFRTTDDPMREVTGAATLSNPDDVENMLRDLRGAGAEVIYDNNAMAYIPGLRKGTPGQFIIDENASYSAWCHEYKHFCDDRADGYLGFHVFEDVAKCRQREIDAYQIEIELASNANRPDIVKRLEMLRDKEVAKYE